MYEKRKKLENGKKSGKAAAYLLKAVSKICLLLAVLAGALSALPLFLGFQAYIIVSGSMEPAIAQGSVVYARYVEPEEIREGDIIVFYGGRNGDAVTTHRVVENRAAEREFITRGDANADNDMLPRPYESLIGRVELSVPFLGKVLSVLSGRTG